MSFQIKEKILEKIKEYDKILIFRHARPDGDCMGASKGLKEIIKASFPDKEVFVVRSDVSEYLAFLGPDDEEVNDTFYNESLGIVVDTANVERVSNQKFSLCREIIKIDHHIDNNPYGDISWVEDKRSSVCEMITDFYNSFKDELVLTKEAASCLYTGIVTDSGRFKFNSVTGDTLRLAGLLLDKGIDTDRLYSNLYLVDFERCKFEAYLYSVMKRTENGAAYIYITRDMQKEFGISSEEAGAAVDIMDSIKGCLCWMVFIENPLKDEIRVRLRSRSMAINTLAQEYGGGGHAQASGATVHSMEEAEEMAAKADKMVKEYKENNEGWL